MIRGRLASLRDQIRREPGLLIAYSGGVDSALLSVVATEVLGDRAVAVTAVSASLPASERRAARQFALAHGIRHVEVCTDEEDRPEYVANGGDRCFHCKSALFDTLEPLAGLMGVPMALGTNLDDLGEHRPGLAAARQRGAIAPLVDVGFTKDTVRLASAELGLVTADKPAAACLASRVAYGDPVTAKVLGRIEAAEDALHRWFAVVRVRSHGDGTIARVELPPSDIERAARLRAELEAALRQAGFTFVTLDLGGYQSGRMNVLLGMPGWERTGQSAGAQRTERPTAIGTNP